MINKNVALRIINVEDILDNLKIIIEGMENCCHIILKKLKVFMKNYHQ